ncbi:MAG TPA: type V CRISPR-associated protein Cas12b [Victivallales bacterium]|nr:type V CRISPR-associated protein Cas12b [Victivallales bacterium]
MPNWQDALWEHHCLFQDAVNYYTLMLAALAYDDVEQNSNDSNDEEINIIKSWAKQVECAWESATKKSKNFDGPHKRISKIIGLEPEKSNFKECVKKILKNCSPNAQIRLAALIQLLKETKGAKLNQVAADRLSWLCSDKLDAATSEENAEQGKKIKEAILAIHNARDDKQLKDAVEKFLDPYNFIKKYPNKKSSEKKFIDFARKKFDKLCKKNDNKDLEPLEEDFCKKAKEFCKNNIIYDCERRTKPVFPYALVLKIMPDIRIAEKFKKMTTSLYKKFSKTSQNTATGGNNENDFEKLRFLNNNKNPFEYFSNIVMKKGENRAAWFEFDKMAFIEALNHPHRFYEDTLERNKAAKKIAEIISAMESKGMEIKSDDENEDDNGNFIPGFSGDNRIELIKNLVRNNLAYLADVDGTESTNGTIEYSIDDGTIRGFDKIREKWMKISEPTEEKLRNIVDEEQAAHRYDFGSAPLFNELAKKEFWPIWKEKGTEDYHSKAPLKDWIKYNNFKKELKQKQRPIKFTPAHPSHSPRYFDFTKKSTKKKNGNSKKTTTNPLYVKHEINSLRFTAGIAIKENNLYKPTVLRFTYSAPRLLRDHLRSDDENQLSSLSDVTWLQPMMEAIDFTIQDPPHANFDNAKISLMPEALDNFQIIFPIEVETEKLHNIVSKKNWEKQFLFGGEENISHLMWPTDKKKYPPEKFWYEKCQRFSCLSVDLGQRTAAAIARIEVEAYNSEPQGKYRFIGETKQKKWFAKIIRTKILRLPGEDQEIWREKSKLEKGSERFSFREELFGSKGRSSTEEENKEARDILRQLDIPEKEIMPDEWEKSLSFPEQNDRLLAAVKRAQYRIRRLHRWAYLLNSNHCNEVKEKVKEEIKDSKEEDFALLLDENKRKEKIESLIINKQKSLTSSLVKIANRVLPLRGRSWIWEESSFMLTQKGAPLQNVRIRGQRGLSIDRIEQITELRKRLQSMNKTLRRKIGEKPQKYDSIPDCCPDILEKLDHIKEQRVNQTAHMILAEALGLKLAPPNRSKDKKDYKHGSYKTILNKNGEWIGPVDFLVIEDLSRYRTTQGRSRRENSRLMKWCHRAIRDKLKDIMKVFFAPVFKENPPLLETPAAYSSRFCSRSGVAGFRAIELAPGFEKKAPWQWMLEKESKTNEEDKPLSKLLEYFKEIKQYNLKIPPKLLAPIAGGPIFVPACKIIPEKGNSKKGILSPKIAQADINAAINLGLRAIASPSVWEIHSRLRSKNEKGELIANEKRKFGNDKIRITCNNNGNSDNKHPNFFADFGNIADWGKASLEKPNSSSEKLQFPNLVLGKALWDSVEKKQWEICNEINKKRIDGWKKKYKKNMS